MISTFRFLAQGAVLAVFLLAVTAAPVAAEQQESASTLPAPSPSVQAEQIRDLIAGRLDPAVDPNDLLVVALAGPAVDTSLETLRALAAAIPAADGAKPPASATSSSPDDDPEAALQAARVAFLSLPEETRRNLLAAHQAKRDVLARAQEDAAQRLAHAAALEARVETLTQFLDGTLTRATDLRALLSLPLVATDVETEGRWRRIRAALADTTADPTAPQQVAPDTEQIQDDPVGSRIQAATAALDAGRIQYLKLPDDAKQALIAKYEQGVAGGVAALEQQGRVSEQAAEVAERGARQAAAEREQTLALAETAQSETLRLFAAEQAALLAVKEQQESLSAEILREQAQVGKSREAGLAWLRRARDLAARSFFDPGKEADADRAYDELVAELQQTRGALRQAIAELASPSIVIPRPAPLSSAAAAADLDTESLNSLFRDLNQNADRVAQLTDDLNWNKATAQRDAMVLMNEARLQILEELSVAKRDDISGFGPAGIAQVRREIAQISLELQFGFLTLPRLFSIELAAMADATVSVAFRVFQVAVGLMLFILWRRHGDMVLITAQKIARQNAQGFGPAMLIVPLLKYFRSVRGPADWLIAVAVLRLLTPERLNASMLGYVWIVVTGALIGSLLTRLIDAMARGASQAGGTRSLLRLRSLRLVAVVVIAIVVILEIAEKSVGRGAIYQWVSDLCWFLALPTGIVLLYWWRTELDRRIKVEAQGSRLLAWCADHSGGPLRYLCLAIAAFVFMVSSVRRYIALKLSEARILREAISIALHQGGTGDDEAGVGRPRTTAIPKETFQQLDPVAPQFDDHEWASAANFDKLEELMGGARGAICALVSERGLGKTTFLAELQRREQFAPAIIINIVEGRCAEILAGLGKAFDCAPNIDAVVDAVRKNNPRIICVDDAQRMIRPKLGGLNEFDDMIDLFRRIDGAAVCLAAIGRTAWRYLERARSERIVFDHVLEIKAWERKQIEKLVLARTGRLDYRVTFETGLVRSDFDFENMGTREERAQQTFFRNLVDYAEGNPAVALEIWRHSLAMDEIGSSLVVSRVRAPSAAVIARLSDHTLFVLRAVMQMELADDGEIIACTALPPTTVLDSLRVLHTAGILETFKDRHRVSLYWYREALRALRRQNLLAA